MACCRRRRPIDEPELPNIVFTSISVPPPRPTGTNPFSSAPTVAAAAVGPVAPLGALRQWAQLIGKLYRVRRLQVFFHATGERLQVYTGGLLDQLSRQIGEKYIPPSKRRARLRLPEDEPAAAAAAAGAASSWGWASRLFGR